MRDVHEAVDGADVIDFLNLGTETSMHTKDRIVHQGCQWQEVEYFSEEPPDSIIAILLYALVIESVEAISVRCLVVASEHSNAVFVSDLQGNYQCKALNAVVASVNVVSQEEEVGVLVKSKLLVALHKF